MMKVGMIMHIDDGINESETGNVVLDIEILCSLRILSLTLFVER